MTSLSGASTLLSAAVIVTLPVLDVASAVIVSFLFVLNEKSPATAGDTATADTVTSTASLDARLSVAVTVLTPPFSPISAGVSTSVTVGTPSSSVFVNVCPVFTDPKVWALGPLQEKSFASAPVPVNCSEDPAGVALDSATPMSVLVMPSAGPLVAVNAPS